MNAWRMVVRGAALLCAVLLACEPAAVRAQGPEPTRPLVEQAREVLVMLNLPADHLRPGSGYGAKGYEDRRTGRARLRVAREVAQRHQLDLVGSGWPMVLLGIDCYVMRVPAGRSVESAVADLSRDPMVAWSQPMQTYTTPGRDDGGTAAPIDAPAHAT